MRKKIVQFLIFADILLLALCIFSYVTRDRKGPVLTLPEESIIYVEGADYSVLLNGATATDEEDGDVSENIRIYSISVMDDDEHALVTYSVCDNSYNFTKVSKTIGYSKRSN